MSNLTWTNDRVDELEDLRDLIIEAKNLNYGSDIISRIKACEKLAQKLSEFDFVKPRKDFITFLRDLAIKDRTENLKLE